MDELKLKVLANFKKEYLRKDYFECHEILEEAWKEQYKDLNKENIYIILLQYSVIQFHLNNDNYIGAKKLLSYLKSHYSEGVKLELAIYIDIIHFDKQLNVLKHVLENRIKIDTSELIFIGKLK